MMSMTCDNSEDLLDLVYGEASAERKASVESHVARCPACAQELQELHAVRRRMNEWKLPSWKQPHPPTAPSLWRRNLAAAAAVLLVLGGAFRLSGGALRAGQGGIEVFWGAGRSSGAEELKTLVAAAEERHRQEIEVLRASIVGSPGGGSATTTDPTDLLRRVSRMIELSEARQSEALRASLQELATETERRRRIDLAKVSAGLSYLDGKNGQHAARTTELMGYLVQAADRK